MVRQRFELLSPTFSQVMACMPLEVSVAERGRTFESLEHVEGVVVTVARDAVCLWSMGVIVPDINLILVATWLV